MNVCIVDDHNLFIEGLTFIMNEGFEAEVISYSDPGLFLQEYRNNKSPDLLITDIEMPQISGLQLVSEVRKINPDQKILVVSMHFNPMMHRSVEQLNVEGFVPKNSSKKIFIEAVKAILAGNKYKNESLIKRIKEQQEEFEILSRREIEVIQYLASGLTSKEVGLKMNISELTINTHRKNILKKLDLKNSSMLIKWAADQKLIS